MRLLGHQLFEILLQQHLARASRGCSRQALRDATLSSDFLNGKRFSMHWLFSAISIGPVDGARKEYGGYEWV
jgi:hypothetical protein